MVDRQPSEHAKQEAFDRAVSGPEPISGSESGTPRPDTTSGTSSLAGVDPDFGLDPHTETSGYGGTDRGRAEMHNPGASRIPGSEGSSLTSGGGARRARMWGAPCAPGIRLPTPIPTATSRVAWVRQPQELTCRRA